MKEKRADEKEEKMQNGGMDPLAMHYGQLLGLGTDWLVSEVKLSTEKNQVVIRLETRPGTQHVCPKCGQSAPLKDHAPERTWRHLDTMQFETVLKARPARVNCRECGVHTARVPWADPSGRFTLMFEAFAIHVIQASASLEQARLLLRLSWKSVQRIIDEAVERGLVKRDMDQIRFICMDEKSFRRGHDYITVMTDIEQSRVLEVSPERTEESTDKLWESLDESQRKQVAAVAMDMWVPFRKSAMKHAPQADIVHDRFHLVKDLNEAVDKVRRAEHRALLKEGIETLKGSKQLWLFHPENLSDIRQIEFKRLRQMELKTSRAWAMKEQFRWFWNYRYAGSAKRFFDKWYDWAIRSQLEPVKKVAVRFKRHLPNILNWFKHRITTGPAEGFNSRIQSIKSAARGFRNFENYRSRIFFFCGKLDLLPNSTH